MERISFTENVRTCPYCDGAMEAAHFETGPIEALSLCTGCHYWAYWPRPQPPGAVLGPRDLIPPLVP